MFRTAYRLPFKVLGIPILLDFSLLIALPLIAWLIAMQIRWFVATTHLPVNIAALEHGWMP